MTRDKAIEVNRILYRIEDYEAVLEQHHMTNGEVDIAYFTQILEYIYTRFLVYRNSCDTAVYGKSGYCRLFAYL